MIVSHSHKFIFFRVPKSGSSSIKLTPYFKQLALPNNGKFAFRHDGKVSEEERNFFSELKKDNSGLIMEPNHTESQACSLVLGKEVCEDYFKFAFVRNPWDRVVSRYFWGVKVNESQMMKEMNSQTFSDYVKNIELDGFASFICSQYQFTEGCDFIGRTEILQEYFDEVCKIVGVPKQNLIKRNVSSHSHYTEYYDDETREIIAQKYAKDIEYFGYKF